MQSIKLNIECCRLVVEALGACDRIYRNAHQLIEKYPADALPLIVFDLHATAPLTAYALKLKADESSDCNLELEKRIEMCVRILREEKKANAVFERFLRSDRGAEPKNAS